MKKTTLLATMTLLAALGFEAPAARAAVTEAWVHRYSNVVSNSNDQAAKVVRDAAGDIIVTGTTDMRTSGQDMLTIKYSGADGSVLWQHRYNGPPNSYDEANAVAVDGSGNVVITGRSMGNGSHYDYYTAKYAAANGALLWEKRYNGPDNYIDSATAVAVDGSDNVVVTGYSSWDYYTAKYAAADGALLWAKRYNGPANSYDQATAVAVDGSGNVVVTGSSYNGDSSFGGNADYYTAKYAASDGALLWEKRGPGGGATALAVDSSGNVVVTGSSYNTNSTGDYYTAKYAAANGALLWEQRYNGPTNNYDSATALAVDANGNVVVTGSSYNTKYDYYTAKYAAADGALLWAKRYNGPANGYDQATAVAVDGSGNVVVTGSSAGTNGFPDYYTAKYAAVDGALLWEQRYNGPANSEDYASAVVVDGSGNVVVTGASATGYDSFGDAIGDYYTAKYATTDGVLLWEKCYDAPANTEDHANAIAVDGSGNVVVTGASATGYYWGESIYVYYTAKYAAADGALLWEKRYIGPANIEDHANAIAVDGSGNVVVTGTSADGYYTAKYAAADGALLWEKRYNGPALYGDEAKAVAVDGSGNVVVTGSSYGGASSYDYYTAKYAASDGALLWEKRYNGPNNQYDSASLVAVDASGNVVVTGTSYNGTNQDYYTAKYAAADGALLWEKRYNGPANSHDSATAVAVDDSGNVVVTGYTDSGPPNYNGDYYTAKYAAADGALLWEKRYNGPANGSDSATAVAVDDSGNVVVTGYTVSGPPNYNADYYTAKYAAVDGALLWEKRYNGPANGSDSAQAVALDGSGNVVVAGYSQKGEPNYDFDYYTAKYAAADGALLWEKRYNGPANGNDTASSLALGPNGMVAITGSSSGDYATVVYRENLPPVSIALVPTGIQLRFTGIPGRSYTIERAPALTGPWTAINTQTAPASGFLEYTDTAPPPGSAFYRTTQP